MAERTWLDDALEIAKEVDKGLDVVLSAKNANEAKKAANAKALQARLKALKASNPGAQKTQPTYIILNKQQPIQAQQRQVVYRTNQQPQGLQSNIMYLGLGLAAAFAVYVFTKKKRR